MLELTFCPIFDANPALFWQPTKQASKQASKFVSGRSHVCVAIQLVVALHYLSSSQLHIVPYY
jgi:hypothetical protein